MHTVHIVSCLFTFLMLFLHKKWSIKSMSWYCFVSDYILQNYTTAEFKWHHWGSFSVLDFIFWRAWRVISTEGVSYRVYNNFCHNFEGFKCSASEYFAIAHFGLLHIELWVTIIWWGNERSVTISVFLGQSLLFPYRCKYIMRPSIFNIRIHNYCRFSAEQLKLIKMSFKWNGMLFSRVISVLDCVQVPMVFQWSSQWYS